MADQLQSHLLDKWKNAFDNKNYDRPIVEDLSKCIDSMQHALLVRNIYDVGGYMSADC